MRKRIEQLLKKVKRAGGKKGSYPFLPEIIQSLEVMRDSPNLSQERRAKMAGALGRLVTEDYRFSESSLGGEILKVVEEFASGKRWGDKGGRLNGPVPK